MARKREFGEGPIFTITNYIFWLAAGSLYFGLCNILFIFVFLTPGADVDPYSYLIMMMISLIPAGPAITALMSAMGKLVREKDVNITRDYFKAYKQSFKQSMAIWLLELAVITVLIIDLRFFSTVSFGLYFKPVMYVIGIVVLCMGLYAFPIISRFYLKTKDVIRLSFYYSITKFKITIMNIAAIIVAYFALTKFPAFAIFFVISGLFYIIMFYEKDILKDLEQQVTKLNDGEDATDLKGNSSFDEEKIFSDKHTTDK